MPQAKTTKKKPTAKVGGGGVNTKKSKLKLKLVVPIVLLVAALGGFYIFQKSSAAGNVFDAGPGSLSGGTTFVTNGLVYRAGGSSGRVSYDTPAINLQKQSGLVNAVDKICAYVTPRESNTTLRLNVHSHQKTSWPKDKYTEVTYGANAVNVKQQICVYGLRVYGFTDWQSVTVYNSIGGNKQFGVNRMWGSY